MAAVLICLVAFAASLLTFFSGFGLGTLLLPAFALFFPAPVAVGLTAVVHLLNNIFKLTLVGRHAHGPTFLRFGVPAALAAFGGAVLLSVLADLQPVFTYALAGRTFRVTPVAFVIALLMLVFAGLELWPRFKQTRVPPRYLPLGGLLTGFLGGLSGHQGALRSVFLLRTELAKEQFIATGTVIAVAVDVVRLAVYSERFLIEDLAAHTALLVAAAGAAFAGAFLGSRLLHKISLRSIELVVAVLLVLIAMGLGSGIIG